MILDSDWGDRAGLLLLAGAAVWLVRWVWILRSDSPRAWNGVMRRFAADDRRNPPQPGTTVFTGSSSIRRWHSLHRDMAPCPVVNRGFGGSRIHQITPYVRQLVVPFRPQVIVFYAGENDIAGALWSRRRSPEEVRQNFADFCAAVHRELPHALILFISIKLSPARLRVWQAVRAANALIRNDCDQNPHLRFIDIVPAMQTVQREPRRDLYGWDGIHLNNRGYKLWTSIVRPALCEALREVNGGAEYQPPGLAD